MRQMQFKHSLGRQILNSSLIAAAIFGTTVSVLTPSQASATASATGTSAGTASAPNRCSSIFRLQAKTVAELAQDGYTSPSVDAFRSVSILKRHWPELSEKRHLMSAIDELLNDESLSTFHILLMEITEATFRQVNGVEGRSALKMSTLKVNWLSSLRKLMTDADADARLDILDAEHISKADLMRALGHQTAAETLRSLVGPNGYAHPSADSLVGRYISEAARLGINVKTLVGRFDQTPDDSAASGPERLYITVDSRTLPLAFDIFAKNPHHMIHNHSPQQGTLYILGMGGNNFNYASNNGNFRFYDMVDSMFPIITLSTTEAANVQNYADLGAISEKFSKYPWGYGTSVNGELRKNYCVQGGYASCTHWWFEMPVGDALVREYRMPKANGDDQYGRSDDGLSNADRSAVRQGPVGEFTHFISHTSAIEIGHDRRDHRLARMVWGQGQGRMQLWQTLGVPATSLDDGSGANPGWVLYTLLGKASNTRVPVVLIHVPDASLPLTAQTLKDLKSKISPK